MVSKKDLVFIFDGQDSLEFIKNLDLYDNTIIICKNADLEKKIQAGRFKTKQISDYYENLGINDKSLKWIKEWPDRIIKDEDIGDAAVSVRAGAPSKRHKWPCAAGQRSRAISRRRRARTARQGRAQRAHPPERTQQTTPNTKEPPCIPTP